MGGINGVIMNIRQWRGKISSLTTRDKVTNYCVRSHVMCRVRKGTPRFRGEFKDLAYASTCVRVFVQAWYGRPGE